MAERKSLSTPTRQAIWAGHNKKCAYTGQPLEWSELEIDHVIPLKDGEEILKSLQDRGLAPLDFDLNGYENLLPTKSFRNGGKSDDPLGESAQVYFLEKAAGAKDKIVNYYNAANKSANILNVYLKLKAQAEKNDLSVEDLVAYLKHADEGEVPIRRSPAIEGSSVYSANSNVAATLMDMTFSFGGIGIDNVRLRNNGGDVIFCHTANEFLAKISEGYWAESQYDMNMAGWARATSSTLKYIRDSQYAVNSRIRDPFVSLSDTDKWSASWITNYTGIGRANTPDMSDCRTISDLVAKGIIQLESVDKWRLMTSNKFGYDVSMQELIRADLNGDDEEEILIALNLSVPDGTFRSTAIYHAVVQSDGLLHPIADK